jgi:sulfite reductase (NADPH) flavoprotein alpha-component
MIHIPDNAPFSQEQRAWLNGFMAGLFSVQEIGKAASAGTALAPVERTPLTILYGSQTGTAEGLARKAAKGLSQQGFSAKALALDECAHPELANEAHLLVITSTYGDGEMPDNAQAFWDFLSAENAPRLEGTAFSVLALGDSSYPDFCQAGKLIDARLEALGARRIHPRMDCDVDADEPFRGWLDGVLQVLKSSQGDGAMQPLALAA